jgi:hypothetical protein
MVRTHSDEYYVLDLCDEVLGVAGSRQHKFQWLRGDVSPRTGKSVCLPVDSYWQTHRLVVEFHEAKRALVNEHFDKLDRLTVSGVDRVAQRQMYDERRAQQIPLHGLRLVVIRADHFAVACHRIRRDPVCDLGIVRALLEGGHAETVKLV